MFSRLSRSSLGLGRQLARRVAGRGAPPARALSTGNPVMDELRHLKKIHWSNWKDFVLGIAPTAGILGLYAYYKLVLVPAQDALVEEHAEDFAIMDAMNDEAAEAQWQDIRRRRQAMYEARGLTYREVRKEDGSVDWDEFDRRWAMIKSGQKWYEAANADGEE